MFLLWHMLTSITSILLVLPPPFVAASDNVTFCQSAGKHATVAAGSTVAATEIDSNKWEERKRNWEGREREEGPKRKEEKKELGEKDKVGKGELKVSTRDEQWRARAECGLPSQVSSPSPTLGCFRASLLQNLNVSLLLKAGHLHVFTLKLILVLKSSLLTVLRDASFQWSPRFFCQKKNYQSGVDRIKRQDSTESMSGRSGCVPRLAFILTVVVCGAWNCCFNSLGSRED